MLNACFYFLVSMSISSSVVIGVLLLVRQIKVIPKRWIYPLWSIALLRMVVPVAVSSSISIFNSVRDLLETRMPVRTVVIADSDADKKSITNYYKPGSYSDYSYEDRQAFTFMNSGGFARVRDVDGLLVKDSAYINVVAMSQYYYPLQYKTLRLTRIFNIGTFIWITGVLVILFMIYILYCTLLYQYKYSFRLRKDVYNHVNASSPFLLGIIKPKIILPTDIDADSLQAIHIIAHERVHIKRKDNLWRLVGLLATCLHWFNPVAWIGYSCFLKDMEFSCDEIVITNYTGSRRKEYAEALLAVAERTHKQNPIPVAFGKTSAGTRIKNILTFQKLSWLGVGISVSFLLMLAAMLMTNAQV